MSSADINIRPTRSIVDALLLLGILIVIVAACLWAFLGINPHFIRFVIRVGGGWILLSIFGKVAIDDATESSSET